MRKVLVTDYFLQGCKEAIDGKLDKYALRSLKSRLNVLLCDYRQDEFYLIALRHMINSLDESVEKKEMLKLYKKIKQNNRKWAK